MPAEKTDEGLKRVVGVSGLTLTIVNGVIGSGIFVLPAIIAIELGSYGVFGYVFCSIIMAAIMLCYAETGSRIITTGGSYAYIEAAFGHFPGYIANWLYFFGWSILGSAAIINVIEDSLAVLFPVFDNMIVRGAFSLLFVASIIIINTRDTKQSIVLVKLITIVKLIPLIAVIIFGFGYVKSSNLHWGHLPSMKTFGNATLILFYAFAGFETPFSASGEIKNSRRTIPLSILLGGIIILCIYMLLQTVTQGVLGPSMTAFKDAPLAAVAEKIVGPVGSTILLITAVISCTGNVTLDILTTPRLLFAGANDGLFPKYLGKLHPRFATPHLAIITYGILIFIFSVSGGFRQLAVLASAAVLLIYLGVILATIRLRKLQPFREEKTFKIPGGLLFPFIGIAAIVWLLASLSKWEILSTIIFIGIICVIYFVTKKFKKERTVVAFEDHKL